MSRLSNPPVLGAALVLLLAGAGALGWVWLRDGRVTPIGIACALLPFALLLWSVSGGAGDRSQIGIAAWAATMFGARVPAAYALQSGPDHWFAQWRLMSGFGVGSVGVLIPFLSWLEDGLT